MILSKSVIHILVPYFGSIEIQLLKYIKKNHSPIFLDFVFFFGFPWTNRMLNRFIKFIACI